MIVVDPDEGFRNRVTADLAANGAAVLALPSVAALRQDPPSSPTVLLFGPNLDPQESLQVFADLEGELGALGGILFVRELDPATMRQAIRGGLSDVLTPDASTEEVVDALARARAELVPARPAGGEGGVGDPAKVVTVFSTKGGCGKSLVASNLAVLLAKEHDLRVALVDLDLQSGDLAIMLQLLPALSLYDASQNVDRLDAEAIAGYLTPHNSGVQLLAAPLEPSVAEAVTAKAITRILELLRASFDVIVVDSPAFFTDQVLAAFDVSDEIILVASMDVPSVKNLRLALTTLAQLGVGRNRIRTVLNRADSNVGLRTSEVEKSLDTRIDVQIPSSRDVPLSVNQGVPLATGRPKSTVVAALRELVGDLAESNPQAEGGRSLFSRRK